jgi:hypothetical protein
VQISSRKGYGRDGESQWECVRNAIKRSNAVNETNMGDVPNTEELTRSVKRLKILIDPRKLPKPKIPRVMRLRTTPETDRITRDYFWDKFERGEKQARERKWI